MSIMFLCACPEARVVSPVHWLQESIFENALYQCPALEVFGPFVLDKGTKGEAYF